MAQKKRLGPHKFENHNAPARFQNAPHFAQSGGGIFKITHAKTNRNGIKSRVSELQIEGIGLCELVGRLGCGEHV